MMTRNLLLILSLFLSFATMTSAANKTTTLVVGATGATGKWVVKLLLDQGHNVKVVVRSKERMLAALQELSEDDTTTPLDHLSTTEASLLDLSDDQLQEQVKDCDAVVSCLGHNMDFKGLWGQPRKLVTDATMRLTAAMAATASPTKRAKFILMGSDGVANPSGQDDKRTFGERIVLSLLRLLVPPHVDNEGAAAYVHSLGTSGTVEWSVVRPTDLIDGKPTGKFQLFDKPQGGLFGAGQATRSHVAQCMVELITYEDKWNDYKFKMPVLHDIAADTTKSEL